MEIKDFIKDALVQIVDGVQEANDALLDKGSYIPTENIMGENGYYDNRVSKDGVVKRYAKVDFDVAVAVSKETTDNIGGKVEADGEMRLQVAWISSAVIDGRGEYSESNSLHNKEQYFHHLKFSLPLALPNENSRHS